MKSVVVFILALSSLAYAETYQLQTKCFALGDTYANRYEIPLVNQWQDLKSACESFQNNMRYMHSKDGVSVSTVSNCRKVTDSSAWSDTGCSGGLNKGYVLETKISISERYRTMTRIQLIPLSLNQNDSLEEQNRQCQIIAGNRQSFSTDQIKVISECVRGQQSGSKDWIYYSSAVVINY